MKLLYILLPAIIIGCKSSNVSSISVTPKETVQQTEVENMLKYLASDELEGRETGTRGIEKAALYLEEFLKKNKVKPYFSSYRDTLTNFSTPAYNIVGVLEGTDPKLKSEYVILSAHYDHIGLEKNKEGDIINNGANDDASGVTAVAQMAKYFSKNKVNKRSILFVFFAGEEKGLLGSKSLAPKLKAQNFDLYTQLNIEMIGVPMKRDFTAYVTGFNLSNMATKINEYSGKKTIGFLPKEDEYKLFYRSDNQPFYEVFNKPCQSVSTFDFENFEYYHHVSDEYRFMDTKFMTNFIDEFIPVVSRICNTPTQEITMNK